MKKFKTHNDGIEFEGSSLQGEIIADYKNLKKVFGKPTKGEGYKVDAEWEIKFDNGVFATIYNYKDGKNYCGRYGIATTKITDWHIGGTSNESVDMVLKTLEEFK